MKRLISDICFLLVLAAGLSSCVKDVVLDAKEEPLLSVYCVLTQDSVQTLKLSWTKGASQAEAPRVTEASAVLTDLTENSEAGRFARISESDWQLEYAAIPGHNYRLEVTTPGHETVWAEQAMPGKLHQGFEMGLHIDKNTDSGPWLNFDIKRLTSYVSWVDGITFGEVTAEGIFYYIVFSNPVWAYAETYDAELEKYVPVKNLCTDYPYVDNFNLTGKLRSGAGDAEFVNVNSPDLVLGSYREFYLTGYSMHRDFLRFPKREDWPRQLENFKSIPFFAIDGDFKEDRSSPTWIMLNRVYFDALSDDYDRYLCEAYQQYYAEQSSDISTIYLRDNLFTNIHGGLGIFGCVTHISQPYFIDAIHATIWMRPRVRIQVFGPKYEPEEEDDDPGNTMPMP
ncbi:MAG: DUF4249 family protein [Bacteroidales bacterium]|nr:DUF4249 family protein [Bacteroidales bacterium]